MATVNIALVSCCGDPFVRPYDDGLLLLLPLLPLPTLLLLLLLLSEVSVSESLPVAGSGCSPSRLPAAAAALSLSGTCASSAQVCACARARGRERWALGVVLRQVGEHVGVGKHVWGGLRVQAEEPVSIWIEMCTTVGDHIGHLGT